TRNCFGGISVKLSWQTISTIPFKKEAMNISPATNLSNSPSASLPIGFARFFENIAEDYGVGANTFLEKHLFVITVLFSGKEIEVKHEALKKSIDEQSGSKWSRLLCSGLSDRTP